MTVDPDSSREVRVLVTLPPDGHPDKSQTITFTAADLFAGEVVTAQDHFIAP
ncbi:Ubp3 associated protein Bre5 [compost metagenome]